MLAAGQQVVILTFFKEANYTNVEMLVALVEQSCISTNRA